MPPPVAAACPEDARARAIGRVTAEHPGRVRMPTLLGATRASTAAASA